jgi:hypothetical protein
MAKCKSCGEEIIWVKTASGKNTPLDAKEKTLYKIVKEGVSPIVLRGHESHWATCVTAEKHRK